MRAEDEVWMRAALKEAHAAYAVGEVPVGAVVVRNGELLCAAHNLRETTRMATAHAELLAIEAACRLINSRRLDDCTLYVTLEPCPMCAGAIVSARIPRVVFGAKDARAGACGSVLNLAAYPLESRPEWVSGVLETDCLAPLTEFFVKRRCLK